MSEQKRIRSRAGACEHKKKCDYLGCKCVVLTLFYFRVRHEHLTKNIASCSFVLVISASFVLFFFLEVSLLVLLVNGFFHTVLLLVHTCFLYNTQIKKCSLLSLSNKRVFITSGK